MVIFNNIVGRFCATLLLLMTILGVMNALLRYYSRFVGVALSSNAFLELQWYLFSAIFLFGAGSRKKIRKFCCCRYRYLHFFLFRHFFFPNFFFKLLFFLLLFFIFQNFHNSFVKSNKLWVMKSHNS